MEVATAIYWKTRQSFELRSEERALPWAFTVPFKNISKTRPKTRVTSNFYFASDIEKHSVTTPTTTVLTQALNIKSHAYRLKL